MNDRISALIAQHENGGDFTHAAPTAEMLEQAQGQLGMTIPRQFVDYLAAYGHGGIGGVEILGVGLDGRMLFLDATLRYRGRGLPSSLLVVENCDEWLYCIDCGKAASFPDLLTRWPQHLPTC